MKDSYSLDSTWEGLDKQYRAHYQSYFNIFNMCGIDSLAVKSDTGMMGGKIAHEFMYLTSVGEDTIMLCDDCGYHSNRQVAEFQKTLLPAENPGELVKKATPDCKTIADLATFLDIPEEKTAKAVFIMATLQNEERVEEQKLVVAILRGDMDLNETKLTNAIKAKEMRPAVDEEIRACGAVPGYASPRGMKNALVVVDDIIPDCFNLVAGANEEGYHLVNVNYGRDFTADIVTDIAAAAAGAPCPVCGSAMNAEKAVEVGNIFKLGTRYSDAMGCTFQDQNGEQKPIIMGSYGIGVGRLLSCVVEEHNDENGMIWPITIAPYQVHLVLLADKSDKSVAENGETLYQDLMKAGVEVLYDDRPESPGIKFADADLVGIPIRLTLSKRSLSSGGIECKLRSEAEKTFIPLDKGVVRVKDLINQLTNEILDRVVPVEYKE